MRTNRARIIVLLVFVVTLGAGVVAGLLAAKLPAGRGPNVIAPGDIPLGEQLELTADQREKMRQIWEGVRDLNDQSFKESQKAEQERDREIAKLIPSEKVQQYRSVQRTYSEANAALIGRRKAAFEKAVATTKGILTPPQQKKYEEILANRLGSDNGNAHEAAELGPATQP